MKTLLQKIWDAHVVAEEPGCPVALYIDLHLVHEVTSPQAFEGLRRRGKAARIAEKIGLVVTGEGEVAVASEATQA